MLLSKRLPPEERRYVVRQALAACTRPGTFPCKVAIPETRPFRWRPEDVMAPREIALAHEVVAEAMVGLEDRVRAFLTLLRQVDSLAQEPCNFCGGGYMMRDLLESLRDSLPSSSPAIPRTEEMMKRARPFLHASRCPLLELRTVLHELVDGEVPPDLNRVLPEKS